MSTDAGSAAAPEDTATRMESSERPGLESGDPQSADSATSTPETADRGVEGSARSSAEADEASDDGSPDAEAGSDAADDSTDTEPTDSVDDKAGVDDSSDDSSDDAERDPNPANEGFITTMLRDATITGLPGETGAPPVEPHSPEAQQEGDEPVGSEPRTGDNPDGVD